MMKLKTISIKRNEVLQSDIYNSVLIPLYFPLFAGSVYTRYYGNRCPRKVDLDRTWFQVNISAKLLVFTP